MELKTVEDILERFNLVPSIEDTRQALLIVANEIKTLKKTVAEHKLLIEHEEAVRTTKATRKSAAKNLPLNFKIGDIICRIKEENKPGKVINVKGSRVKVIFGDQESWVEARSIQYYKRVA